MYFMDSCCSFRSSDAFFDVCLYYFEIEILSAENPCNSIQLPEDVIIICVHVIIILSQSLPKFSVVHK